MHRHAAVGETLCCLGVVLLLMVLLVLVRMLLVLLLGLLLLLLLLLSSRLSGNEDFALVSSALLRTVLEVRVRICLDILCLAAIMRRLHTLHAVSRLSFVAVALILRFILLLLGVFPLLLMVGVMLATRVCI